MIEKIKLFFHHITAETVAGILILLGILVIFVGFFPDPLPRIVEDLYANLQPN